MVIGLVAALGSALCSGVANIAQARGAGRPGVADELGPALVLRLLRSGTYLAGLVLVAAGFVLSVVALRELPVFVVAVARATSLGVTALLAWPVLGVRLRRRDWVALVALAIGLVIVVTAGADGPAAATSAAQRWSLLIVVLVLAATAVMLGRLQGSRVGVALAGLAGLAFGLSGVAVRLSTSGALNPGLDLVADLVSDPAAWAVLVAGPLGVVCFAAALQRSPVTAVTAVVVGVETLVGAVVGIALLGDGTRSGWQLAGLAGFALALGGAVALAGTATTAGRPGVRTSP